MKTFVAYVVSWLLSFALTLWLTGCGQEPPQKPSEYLRPTATQTAPATTQTAPAVARTAPMSVRTIPPAYGQNQPLYVDSSGTPHMRLTETGKVIETKPLSGIEHGARRVAIVARKAADATSYGVGWVLLALGIMIPGPFVIIFIPGFITGRAEKILEGLAIGAWGLFLLSLTSDAGITSLTPWVWGVLVVPGALLLLWGLASDNESGKFVLVTGPVIVFGLYMFAQIYRMVVLGAVGSAVLAFLIIALAAAIIIGAASRLGGTQATT